MTSFDYHRPHTIADALALAQQTPAARFIAGGTDLLIRCRRREIRPPALISLRSIPELAAIEVGAQGGRIGALATIRNLIDHDVLQERYPLLTMAARALGSEQIRNVATVGGNLCNASPCADTAPALLCYEAELEIRGPGGSRRAPLEEFLRGPGETSLEAGELVAAILLGPPPRHRANFLKLGRVRMDLAKASLAALVVGDDDHLATVRLAVGSVYQTSLRLRAVERLLEGQVVTPALLAEAEALARSSVKPISDVRSTEEYRRHVVGVLLRRAVESLLSRSHA
jgi:carbon-monoxide dehydrogenase medium subunit